MAEFVSAIIGIAAAALHSSNVLVELTAKTKNAPKEIQKLKKDVSKVLSSLDTSLNSSRVRESLKSDPEIMRALQNLQTPLQNCSEIYDDLVRKLKGFMKPSDDKSDGYTITAGNRLLWYIYRSELNDMLSSMDRSKSTLDTAMNVVIM